MWRALCIGTGRRRGSRCNQQLLQFLSSSRLSGRRRAMGILVAGLLGLAGCHGPLGDWMSRTSLSGNGVPAQSEPDIDFEMAEPERTADADDE